MSNGRAVFGSISTDDATLYVGDWWSNSRGSGGYLYIDEPHAVYLTHGETILLVATLMATMSEYERSLISNQVIRIKKKLDHLDNLGDDEVGEAGEMKLVGAEALDQLIGAHNEAQWRAQLTGP